MSIERVDAVTGAGEQPIGLVPTLRFPEFQDAGEWEQKVLGKVCRPQQWTTISSSDLVKEGYPVYGANGWIGHYTEFNHEFETVAVTCRGSTCGEVALIPPKSYITGNSMCLDEINDELNDYRFVYQLLKHRGFDDIISGSAQPQIVGSAIKVLKVIFPKRDEQQKIADCLSSLDAVIAAEGDRLAALKDHKKGLMQRLFPAKDQTTPRLRFPEFEGAGEWGVKPLGEIATYQNGKAYEPHIVEAGRYVVVNARFISTDGTAKKWSNNPILIADKDDILMVLSDLPNGRALAKCYRVREDDKYAVNQRIVRLKPHAVRSDFLFSVLNRHPYLLGFNDGLNQTHLSKDNVLTCPILMPKEENEQIAIADCLEAADNAIARQSDRLDALKLHKKGLMQQLFPSSTEATA